MCMNQLSVNQKAKIKTEMRILEEICDQNIRGCSVLESAESINPALFKEMLEVTGCNQHAAINGSFSALEHNVRITQCSG